MTLRMSRCLAISSSTCHTLISVYCVIVEGGRVTEREKSTWWYGEDTVKTWWLGRDRAIRSVRQSFCPSSPVEQEKKNWQQRFYSTSSSSSSFFLLLTTGGKCQQPRRLVSVIKRESQRGKKREIETRRERKTYARQKNAGRMLGRKEKINVSSLLQIRCRLKS